MNMISRRDFNTAVLLAGCVTSAAGPGAFAAPGTVLRRAIPSSGETIPVVGLGTNRYGVGPTAADRAPLRQALARFHELGGTLVDTAPMYRTSETVLGDLIAELGIRDELFIATKVDRDSGRRDSDAQMRDSARKLHTDCIDLMQVHNVIDWRRNLPLLQELKQDGRFRYVGLTTSQAQEYGEMEKAMTLHDLDFIQVNYSLEQRESAERLLPLATDRGMAVIINRTFGAGRIFAAVGAQPLPGWAADIGVRSWAQFLLKYSLSHPAATVVIPGMTKAHHVDDNFGAAYGPMPDAATRAKMEAFYDAL